MCSNLLNTMNIFISFLAKLSIYLSYKKEIYLFARSKKYITRWGEGSYGIPSIISYDKHSSVAVGNYVSIASGVHFLLGANHKMGCITTYPWDKVNTTKNTFDASERGNITIGNDVWIGYGATIIGEVTIGNGAIVGALALVVDDVPPYAVVGGVPARVIKYRFSEENIKNLEAIAWWNWGKRIIEKQGDDLYSTTVEEFIGLYSRKEKK